MRGQQHPGESQNQCERNQRTLASSRGHAWNSSPPKWSSCSIISAGLNLTHFGTWNHWEDMVVFNAKGNDYTRSSHRRGFMKDSLFHIGRLKVRPRRHGLSKVVWLDGKISAWPAPHFFRYCNHLQWASRR